MYFLILASIQGQNANQITAILLEKPPTGACNENLDYNISAERNQNTGPEKPTLKTSCGPALLYALEGSKTLTAKGRLQKKQRAATFHVVFQFQAEMRISANLYFIANLKYGTIITTMLIRTNILTLQPIFETYCMPGTTLFCFY